MYRPWQALGELPHILHVKMRLPGSARSWWLPAERAIVLDDRLLQVERRCALAHELVHAERSDTVTVLDRVNLRQEQHADREAACRLIPLDRLVRALLWTNDDAELADELNVDLHTLYARKASLTEGELGMIQQRLFDAEARMP